MELFQLFRLPFSVTSARVRRSENKAHWEQTEKGRTYRESTAGKNAASRAIKKYTESPKGKNAASRKIRKYTASSKGKNAASRAVKKYFGTDQGKVTRSNISKKYFGTAQGKVTRSNISLKYFRTKKGSLIVRKAVSQYQKTSRGKVCAKARRKANENCWTGNINEVQKLKNLGNKEALELIKSYKVSKLVAETFRSRNLRRRSGRKLYLPRLPQSQNTGRVNEVFGRAHHTMTNARKQYRIREGLSYTNV